MLDTNKVVAGLLDGRRVKGTTRDFSPTRPVLRIGSTSGDSSVTVRLADLKALFFVRSLDGDHIHRMTGFPSPVAARAQGKKVAVQFRDGELLCGYALAYTPERDGFFLVPADPRSNNLRVYVLAQATTDIAVGSAAEALLTAIAESSGPSAGSESSDGEESRCG
jgi:hypothetical protein